MKSARWARVKDVFTEASKTHEPALRETYLRDACAEDSSLYAEIEELLRQHEKPGPFLEVPTSASNKRLLQYEVLERIADGGMGVAYKARDTRLNRIVAIKLLPPWLAASPSAKEQLANEAQCASALNHPNIVTIHDLASYNGVDFIVMEYVQGRTLHEVLAAGQMDTRQALAYSRQIAQALARAHEAGIVHGDLKPANIMITPYGQAKLLDFGLARVVGEEEDPRATPRGGTPDYAAPEQARGIADQRSDVYSLGLVLYEMLTGHRPVRARLENSAPPSAHMIWPEQVPAALREIVAKCLQDDPAKRWQAAETVEAELEQCEAHLSKPFSSSSISSRREHATLGAVLGRRVVAIGIGVGLVISALGGWLIVAKGRNSRGNEVSTSMHQQSDLTLVSSSAEIATQREYNEAIFQMRQKNWQQAKTLFDRVLRTNPGDLKALKNRAVCLQNLHRFQEAIADFSAVLRRNQKDAGSLYDRAMCYMNLESLNEAYADLTALIQIDPSVI